MAAELPGDAKGVVVIVIGLRHSGRSLLLQRLEEAGFSAVDNLPPRLLAPLLGDGAQRGAAWRLAVAMDLEGPGAAAELEESLDRLDGSSLPVRLVLIDAQDQTLRDRLAAAGGAVLSGWEAELERRRAALAGLRSRADLELDSSYSPPRELLVRVLALAGLPAAPADTELDIASFGFKHGIPQGDLVVDLRFIRNPYYEESLRPLTGLDAPCSTYVLAQAGAMETLASLVRLAEAMLPAFRSEGRQALRIRLGCTGGQHRSVAMAEALGAELRARGLRARVRHAELEAGRAGTAGKAAPSP